MTPSDAISTVGRFLDGQRFSPNDLGHEKRHNCKFTALQAFQLLILCRVGDSPPW